MSISIQTTTLPGVLLIYPRVFEDARGFFQELWNAASFREAGLSMTFVQDNFSRSLPGVLRGLHYQLSQPQGKLVRVTRGRVLDVAVDLRRQSPAFGKHTAVELGEDNHAMLWIPPGFGHGFRVLGNEPADMHYKCTDGYCPEGIATDGPTAQKDSAGDDFASAEVFTEYHL